MVYGARIVTWEGHLGSVTSERPHNGSVPAAGLQYCTAIQQELEGEHSDLTHMANKPSPC